MYILAVQTAEDSPPQQIKITGNRITIGRRQDNDFRIKDPFVSAYHAEIVHTGSGEYEIVDLQSFNGTFLRGQRIDRAPIHAGDELRIGVLKARVLEEGQTWETQKLNPKPKSPVVKPLNERKTRGAISPVVPDARAGASGPTAAKPALAGIPRAEIPTESSEESSAAAKNRKTGSPAIPDPHGIGIATVLPSLAVERAKIELKKIRADLEKTKTELAAARDAEQDAAQRAADSRETIEALERAITEFESRAQRESSDLKQQIRALEESKEELESKTAQEIFRLREQVQTLEGSKRELESETGAEIASLKSTIERLEKSDREVRRKLAEKDAEFQQKTAAEVKKRGALEEQESRLAELRKEWDRAKAETSAMDADLRRKRAESERLGSEIEKAKAEISALDAQLGQQRQELERLHFEIEGAKALPAHASLASLPNGRRKRRQSAPPPATLGWGNFSPPGEPAGNSCPGPANGEDNVSRLKDRIRLLASGLPLFAAAAERRNNPVSRSFELDKREARLIERELKFKKRAGLEKEFRKRLKELEKHLEETEKACRQEERKLERKLHELKLAEDRIETAANLGEEINQRKERLAGLEERLDRTVRQLEEWEARRDEMHSAAAVHAPNATARVSVRAAQALESLEEREAFAKDLEDKIAEYEQYQQILRVSLHPDLATVQVMGRQLIRRLDLLEDMVRYYRGKFAADTASQLETLRDSFLDLLNENKVTAYSFPPGTELNLDYRRKIKIVESRNGSNGNKETPRILETVRPGYLCGGGEGEIILRKAEVITQS